MRSLLDLFSKRFFLIATTIMLMVTVFSFGPVYAGEFNVEEFASKYAVWIGLIFVVVEYILGKTELVKSGSTLELVINTIVGLLKKFIGPNKSSLTGLK